MDTEDLIQHYTYQQSEIIDTEYDNTDKINNNNKNGYENTKNAKIKVYKFAHKNRVKCPRKCMIKEKTYSNDHKVIKLK